MTLPDQLRRIEEKLDRLLRFLGDEDSARETTKGRWEEDTPYGIPDHSWPPERFLGTSPFAIPNADAESRCGKCGITFKGVSGYACTNAGCAMGLGPAGTT